MNTDLYGTYINSLDSKNRVAIPAKIRNVVPDNKNDRIFITRGIDTCITGYFPDEWTKFRDRLNKVKLDEKTKRKVKREFIGRAIEATFDKQGRIVLPQDLIEFAQLESVSEVRIVGSVNFIEIWNPQVYQQEVEASEEIIQKTMENLDLSDDEFAGAEA